MQKTTYISQSLEPMHYALLLAFFIVLSIGVTYIEMRINDIRAFNRRNNLAFYIEISLNPALTDENKAAIGMLYHNKLPNFFTLLLSNKKLDRYLWFSKSEQALFFNANPLIA